MQWWIIAGLTIIVVAYVLQTTRRRWQRERMHDQDVNRRIDERLENMDLKRPQDKP